MPVAFTRIEVAGQLVTYSRGNAFSFLTLRGGVGACGVSKAQSSPPIRVSYLFSHTASWYADDHGAHGAYVTVEALELNRWSYSPIGDIHGRA